MNTNSAFESARVIQSNQNVLIALDLVELESGGRVDGRRLWVDGPNSDAGISRLRTST